MNGPKPKYNLSRNWYVADFGHEDYDDVRAWCAEQFGPEPDPPDAWSRWPIDSRWQHRYEQKIHFRDEKDYAWFMLRWS